MIKTFSGEMVEPRVGMVVTGLDMNKEKWISTVVEDDTGFYTNNGYMTTKDGQTTRHAPEWAQKEITLLHTPFMVGDEVEHFNLRYEVWDSFILEEAHSTKELRHLNPALRDHPDYESK